MLEGHNIKTVGKKIIITIVNMNYGKNMAE